MRETEADKEREERAALCAAEAISLFPCAGQTRQWWVLSCRKGVAHRRGSNRITPPLTQGSCLSEMLSLQAYVSIMPACVAMQYKKCCIYLSFNQGTYGVCQICQGEHIKMEQN